MAAVGLFVAVLLAVTIILFFWLMKYRSIVGALRRILGDTFVNVVSSGGDGILAAIINNQDVDFVFFPVYKKDNNFYYVEITVQSKNGLRKEHFKIAKDDVFLLRNHLLFAFLLRDKMRAINLDHVKTFELVDEDTKREIVRDYVTYRSLQNEYKNLSARIIKARDSKERERLMAEREQLHEKLKKLEKKWGAVLGRLDTEKAVVFEEETPEGEKILHVVRSVNFEKLADVMTGVRPNEIYDTAVSMYNRFIMEFLKDWSRAFKVPFGQQGSSNTMFYLLIVLIIVVFIIVAFRGG